MIIPYEYRGATVEGFYDPDETTGEMKYTAYVEHPKVEQLACFTAPTWDEAKMQAETAIDELIESWN